VGRALYRAGPQSDHRGVAGIRPCRKPSVSDPSVSYAPPQSGTRASTRPKNDWPRRTEKVFAMMRFVQLGRSDARLIELNVRADDCGSFRGPGVQRSSPIRASTSSRSQDNNSVTRLRGSVRGMHYARRRLMLRLPGVRLACGSSRSVCPFSFVTRLPRIRSGIYGSATRRRSNVGRLAARSPSNVGRRRESLLSCATWSRSIRCTCMSVSGASWCNYGGVVVPWTSSANMRTSLRIRSRVAA
jgi:hypothetical protein